MAQYCDPSLQLANSECFKKTTPNKKFAHILHVSRGRKDYSNNFSCRRENRRCRQAEKMSIYSLSVHVIINLFQFNWTMLSYHYRVRRETEREREREKERLRSLRSEWVLPHKLLSSSLSKYWEHVTISILKIYLHTHRNHTYTRDIS